MSDNVILDEWCSGLVATWVHPCFPSPSASTLCDVSLTPLTSRASRYTKGPTTTSGYQSPKQHEMVPLTQPTHPPTHTHTQERSECKRKHAVGFADRISFLRILHDTLKAVAMTTF